MTPATPIVFVVDDDISVRESLQLLIECEGWHPETFRIRTRVPRSPTKPCSELSSP